MGDTSVTAASVLGDTRGINSLLCTMETEKFTQRDLLTRPLVDLSVSLNKTTLQCASPSQGSRTVWRSEISFLKKSELKTSPAPT